MINVLNLIMLSLASHLFGKEEVSPATNRSCGVFCGTIVEVSMVCRTMTCYAMLRLPCCDCIMAEPEPEG